uniref:Uncharacterized protein n=1 Tax=Picea glauca TaxID=3330 RepID=A0A101LY48_PICGL|nr:hypothetical protein ABT39_MTgene5671 [Picea glauca]
MAFVPKRMDNDSVISIERDCPSSCQREWGSMVLPGSTETVLPPAKESGLPSWF